MKVIVVTSPVSDSGKTMLALGLCETAASLGHATLFIDLDNHPGELLQMLGYDRRSGFPTVASWSPEGWEACARSPAGAVVLPAPDMPDAGCAEQLDALIASADGHFELTIIDAGIRPTSTPCKSLLDTADIAALVADCDSKAMFRLNEFLESRHLQPRNGWTLFINNRDGRRGYYSARQMSRTLSRYLNNRDAIEIPFYPHINKKNPPIIAAGEPFAVNLITNLFRDPDHENRRESLPAICREISAGSDPACASPMLPMESHSPQRPPRSAVFLGFISRKFWPRNTQGVVINGSFISDRFVSPIQALDKYSGTMLDAIIMPASMGFEALKEYRRDTRSQTVLLIVTGGSHDHIALGADRVAARINSELIQSAGLYAGRLRELWSRVELDYLTGCYKREFFEAWLKQQEEQERLFSIVFIDPDHFKRINDSFGHDAGDSVLMQFSSFLSANSRCHDLVFRWGGDEFVVAMPDTRARQAYALIDRLREKWASRVLHLPGGQTVCSTFSAGVAEYYPGCNVVKIADEMMYKAKQNGRNQVKADFFVTMAVLGSVPCQPFSAQGYILTNDILEADYIICDANTIRDWPLEKTVYILGQGTLRDWLLRRSRPECRMRSDINAIIADIEAEQGEPETLLRVKVQELLPAASDMLLRPSGPGANALAVLPGARGSGSNQTVPLNGALFVVCPSRPGLAGEVAASLALAAGKCALVCASTESTAAVELKIPDDVLITSDWRLPGARSPIDWGGLKVWPVDPHKFLNPAAQNGLYTLVEQIKAWFALVIVDCAGSLALCSRVAKNEGIVVLRKEGDIADTSTSQWLKKYGGNNIMVMAPSEQPSIVQVENGFIITSQNKQTGIYGHRR